MWYHVPSSAFAQAPEDSTWESSELCEALSRSATWNTKSLPAKSWQRVLRTVPYMTRRSGLICTPSTAARGVESWKESLAATLASRSQLPASDSGPQIPAISGPRSSESFAKWNLDGASSRTWLDTFGLDTTTLSAPTLNALATASRKASSRRRKSAHPIDGNGSSSWPTSQSRDWKGSSGRSYKGEEYDLPTAAVSLGETAEYWMTPSANEDAATHQAKRFLLDPETPPHGGESSETTPTSRRQYPTPTSGDSEGSGAASDRLGGATGAKRQLNPRFVEWLQGWPPGWTSLAPLGCDSRVTESCLSRQSEPSSHSGDNWPTPDTQNARDGVSKREEASGKHAMRVRGASRDGGRL